MSDYQRVKLWRMSRAWRKTPLTLNLQWRREHEDLPILFKFHRQFYLLCSTSLARQWSLSDQLPSTDARLHRPREHFDLSAWLPLLQRFMGVAVTARLEDPRNKPYTPHELIGEPLTATIAHHLFGLSLRREHTEAVQALRELIRALEESYKIPSLRLKPEFNENLMWSQRRLRKLYRRVKALSQKQEIPEDQGLEALHQFLILKQQALETLTWLFFYLNERTQISELIFNEINDHLSTRIYQQDDLLKSPTLYKWVLETLRVAPPHWITMWGEVHQVVRQEVYLERFAVLPPQTQLMTSPFLDHQTPQDWPSPYSFTPDRFLPMAYGAPLPDGFIPLGVGALGQDRFQLVLHTVIAVAMTLLRRGEVEVELSNPLELEYPKTSSEQTTELPFVEHRASAVGCGAPDLTLKLKVNERYIYIPSARI